MKRGRTNVRQICIAQQRMLVHRRWCGGIKGDLHCIDVDNVGLVQITYMFMFFRYELAMKKSPTSCNIA